MKSKNKLQLIGVIALLISLTMLSPQMTSATVDLTEVTLPKSFIRSNITIYVPDDASTSFAFDNPELTFLKVGNMWAITGVIEALADEISASVGTDEEQNVYVVPPDEDIINENGEHAFRKFGGDRTYLNKSLGLGNDDFSSTDYVFSYTASVNVTAYPYLLVKNMRSVSTTSNTTIVLKYANSTGTGAGVWVNKTGVVNIYNDFDSDTKDRWWNIVEHVSDQTPFYGTNITISNIAMDSVYIFKTEDPLSDSRYEAFYFGSVGSTQRGVSGSISPDLELVSLTPEQLVSPVNAKPVGMSGSEWLSAISSSEFLASGASDVELEKTETQRTFGWETVKNMEWDVVAELARKAGLSVDDTLEGTQQYPSVVDDYKVNWARPKLSVDTITSQYLWETIQKHADSSRSLETVIEETRQDTLTSIILTFGTAGANAINDLVKPAIDQEESVAVDEAVLAGVSSADGGATSIELDKTTELIDTTLKGKFDTILNFYYSGQSAMINEALGLEAGSPIGIAVALMLLLFTILGGGLAIYLLVKWVKNSKLAKKMSRSSSQSSGRKRRRKN